MAMTLRQLREVNGLTQTDISKIIRHSVPDISTYENDLNLPDLQDVLKLESVFNSPITFPESLTVFQKQEILQNIVHLSERFPLIMVLIAVLRALKDSDEPAIQIASYVKKMRDFDEIPGLPFNQF